MKMIGLLPLGQSPRPDFIVTLAAMAPNIHFRVRGSLDNLSKEEIQTLSQKPSSYKLLTICQNRQSYEIGMEYLIPFLEKAANHLAKDGASPIILMCAARFPELKIRGLVLPYQLMEAHASDMSRIRCIGVITPNPSQIDATLKGWIKIGFKPRVLTASPFSSKEMDRAIKKLKEGPCELILLDCMGFSPSQANAVKNATQKKCTCPQTLIGQYLKRLR